MVGCSPGGQVATGGYDGAVRLLDRHTGNLAAEIYQYSGDTKSWLHTTSFTVSPGRKQYLAAGSRDALVSVWANSNSRAGSDGGGSGSSSVNLIAGSSSSSSIKLSSCGGSNGGLPLHRTRLLPRL
jgi:WD40 repeat protein